MGVKGAMLTWHRETTISLLFLLSKQKSSKPFFFQRLEDNFWKLNWYNWQVSQTEKYKSFLYYFLKVIMQDNLKLKTWDKQILIISALWEEKQKIWCSPLAPTLACTANGIPLFLNDYQALKFNQIIWWNFKKKMKHYFWGFLRSYTFTARWSTARVSSKTVSQIFMKSVEQIICI